MSRCQSDRSRVAGSWCALQWGKSVQPKRADHIAAHHGRSVFFAAVHLTDFRRAAAECAADFTAQFRDARRKPSFIVLVYIAHRFAVRGPTLLSAWSPSLAAGVKPPGR